MKKSYGLQVAKLAGLWKNVLQTAKNMLLRLEQNNTQQLTLWNFWEEINKSKDTLQCVSTKNSELEEQIKNLDINLMTPMDALNFLYELKK
jgi:DNA mismatch repair protein MutS